MMARDATAHRRRFSTENREASRSGSAALRPFRPGGRRRGVLACMNSAALPLTVNLEDERRAPSRPGSKSTVARGFGQLVTMSLVLRSVLTPLRGCDPARVWMTAKTQSITRDIARPWRRASWAPHRADIGQASLARSGGPRRGTRPTAARRWNTGGTRP